MSWFANVEAAAPIEVFALTQAFNDDSHPQKVNLGVGAYRNDDAKPVVLPVVRAVEAQMAADQTLNHEYLPVPGLPDYRTAATKLLLGDDSPAIAENRTDGIQAIGGTGALRIAFDFLRTRLGMDTLYVSTPTWGNHNGLAKAVGFNLKAYRYWDESGRKLDIDGMIEDLKNAPERSVIVLHMCAHNPTGMDPSEDQWKLIANTMREKKLFPLFDCAYQGFSSGDLNKDAWSARFFVKEGFEIFAAQSFSKNFGLYNERVGNLTFVVDSPDKVAKVRSQLAIVVRTTWSNSPNHGGRVVASVLNNPQLKTEWEQNVKQMAERILLMRKMLFDKLKALGTPGTWNHIVEQSGMFSYTGLNGRQCDHLVKNYHIYLLNSGRINMCGLTTKNIDYVAAAFDDVVKNIQGDPAVSKV